VETTRQNVDEEDENKEIERIQYPTEDAG